MKLLSFAVSILLLGSANAAIAASTIEGQTGLGSPTGRLRSKSLFGFVPAAVAVWIQVLRFLKISPRNARPRPPFEGRDTTPSHRRYNNVFASEWLDA